MSTQPHDDWWASPSGDGPLYGQPFDPSASHPQQQPPPPDWEKGTWTHHSGAPAREGNAQTWLLVAIVLVVLAIAVVAVLMFL